MGELVCWASRIDKVRCEPWTCSSQPVLLAHAAQHTSWDGGRWRAGASKHEVVGQAQAVSSSDRQDPVLAVCSGR